MSSRTLAAPTPDLSSGVFTDMPSRDAAVSVRGLSKSYSIAKNAVNHTSAGEAIMHRLRHPFEKAERDTFWALNDVSFDIQKGDVVGIIGRNGAGKSTLLKILSRITAPTKGKIDLYGRVGSLLEVGTGFHPELTGRENIFLNGAILGMQKSEIARQFDAIVEFSGTEQFLDTPVKRYSSGMYVRLAFAVAAHLNPEILIIDEVLAVGDAEFQKKCLGKMQDVADSGRTVLFVSHNMATINQLCRSAILLNRGNVVGSGTPDEIIAQYLAQRQGSEFNGTINRHGLQLNSVELIDVCSGGATSAPIFNRDYELVVSITPHKALGQGALWVKIYDEVHNLVSSLCTIEEGVEHFDFSAPFEVSFFLPRLQLLPGTYTVGLTAHRFHDPTIYLEEEEAFTFEVEPAIVNDGAWPYKRHHGVVRVADNSTVRFV